VVCHLPFGRGGVHHPRGVCRPAAMPMTVDFYLARRRDAEKSALALLLFGNFIFIQRLYHSTVKYLGSVIISDRVGIIPSATTSESSFFSIYLIRGSGFNR